MLLTLLVQKDRRRHRLVDVIDAGKATMAPEESQLRPVLLLLLGIGCRRRRHELVYQNGCRRRHCGGIMIRAVMVDGTAASEKAGRSLDGRLFALDPFAARLSTLDQKLVKVPALVRAVSDAVEAI